MAIALTIKGFRHRKRFSRFETFPKKVQPPSNIPVMLQAIANSTSTILTSTVPTAKPLWLTAAELVLAVGVITVVGALFSRLVRSIALRAGASKAVASSVTQWMGVLVLLADAAAVTTIAGVSSTLTTLTLSGIGGLAVSLALQTTLSNIISGVLLLHDGFIRLGDDLQYGSPGGVRGEVVKLSLRSTWLKSADGSITVVGNTNLAAGPIINYTAAARLGKKLNL
jgi:small conductance mechanosensitive channel